jgi:hypothetical protein
MSRLRTIELPYSGVELVLKVQLRMRAACIFYSVIYHGPNNCTSIKDPPSYLPLPVTEMMGCSAWVRDIVIKLSQRGSINLPEDILVLLISPRNRALGSMLAELS